MENNTEKKKYDISTPESLAKSIVKILDDKLAGDIRLLHVTEKTIIADYFVICTGTSSTQIRSLSGEIEYLIGEAGQKPGHIEGYPEGNWICMDYHSVIVHIFSEENRSAYRLEKLWEDAEEVDIKDSLTER